MFCKSSPLGNWQLRNGSFILSNCCPLRKSLHQQDVLHLPQKPSAYRQQELSEISWAKDVCYASAAWIAFSFHLCDNETMTHLQVAWQRSLQGSHCPPMHGTELKNESAAGHCYHLMHKCSSNPSLRIYCGWWETCRCQVSYSVASSPNHF